MEECQHSLQVTIYPVDLKNVARGIRAYLDTKVNTYLPELGGLLLSYKEARPLARTVAVHHAFASARLPVQIKCFVFRPRVGLQVDAMVQAVKKDVILCLAYDIFNITVHSSYASEVEVGKQIRVKITEVRSQANFVTLRGLLVRERKSSIGSAAAGKIQVATPAKSSKKRRKE